MISLAITTSFGKLSLALFNKKEALFEHGPVKLFQADIAKVTQEAFATTGITPGQLDRLIVDVGPGGTSSVRTGVAFANALSYGLKVPVSAVSSLEALCFQAADGPAELPRMLGVANSLGNTLYFGFYGEEKFELAHGTYAEVEDVLTARNIVKIVGDYSVADKLAKQGKSKAVVADFQVETRFLLKVASTRSNYGVLFPDLPIPIAELITI